MATRYKIGIVGYGKISQDQHAPAIAASDRFELVAVSNASGAPPAGVQAYPNCAALLKAGGVDAVSICTPPGPRRTLAAQCLAAGMPVLLEKPPAGSVAEVADIGKLADAAGKTAFTTYHAQHNAAVKRAGEMLAGKTLKALHVTWKEDVRRWHPGQDWILAAGGFGVFDPGINAMSILVRILPEPLFMSAATLSFPANRGAPIAADLTFATGGAGPQDALKGVLDWRQTGPQTWEIEVETTDGLKLKLSDGGSKLETDGQPPFVGAPDEYPDIYRDFAALLDKGASQVDPRPFQLLADAFMLGKRVQVDAFEF